MFNKRPKLPIDWDRIEASAPGRFVVIGEFGDMDDKNTIAMALDRRLRVTIRPHKEGYVRLNLKDFKNVREWPITAPVFTMTKLVANYADTLSYSETLHQTLKPLLHQKYYKTNLNVQHHSQSTTATSACDDADTDSSEDTSSGGDDYHQTTKSSSSLSGGQQTPQTISNDEGLAAGPRPEAENKPTNDPDLTTSSEREQHLFHEVKDLNARVLDPVSQTDSAVIAFFMLYIALGDSFAGSCRPSIDIEIESEIPMCRGLGSSTALGVALCGALMKVFRISAEPSVITEWAHCVDKLFHTMHVTGVHSSVVAHGGYVYYQKDRVKSFGIQHQVPLGVMLIDSGFRRDPKEFTNIVVKMLKLKHDIICVALTQISALASTLWRQLSDQQLKAATIRQNIMLSQGMLCGLGLDPPNVEYIQRLALRWGLAVKQSQAGETLFMLYDELNESVQEFAQGLKEANIEYSHHEICFRGLNVSITRSIPNTTSAGGGTSRT